nr:cache domain-containing protein [Candidatus Sigynarchaeota archaeon]
MNTTQKQKGSLRKEILTVYAIFTIIALGSIAATAGMFIGIVGNTASSQTSTTLTQQVQFEMQNRTYQTAQLIQGQLQDAVNDLQSLSGYVQTLWSIPKTELGYRASYYHIDFIPSGTTLMNGTVTTHDEYYPANVPPGTENIPRYVNARGHNVSFEYSHYLVFPTAYEAMSYDLAIMNQTFKDVRDRSAQLDIPFGQIMKIKPQYTWIYMEYKEGLDRCMPWHGTDSFVFPPDSLDLRLEPYYTDAAAALGAVNWKSPYNDPSGMGFMITISRAVYNGTVSSSHLIGVLCIDITIDTMRTTIGNIRLYQTGYGFLIDKDGYVVSHKDYTANPADDHGPELTVLEPSIPTSTYNAMKAGQTGLVEMTKNGKVYYLSYEPVPISGYSLGIMVPEEEALAPVAALQQQVALNLTVQLVIMLGILGVILIVALWIGLTIANSVVAPVQKLTNMALKLSTEDIKTTVKEFDTTFTREMKDEEEKDDEIGRLTRAFKGLVRTVQEDAKKEVKDGKGQ